MTTEICRAYCAAYAFFGTEYGKFSPVPGGGGFLLVSFFFFSPPFRSSCPDFLGPCKVLLRGRREADDDDSDAADKADEADDVCVGMGSQCFCGNQLFFGAAVTGPAPNCQMPCAGNKTEMCGGAWSLNLYVQG